MQLGSSATDRPDSHLLLQSVRLAVLQQGAKDSRKVSSAQNFVDMTS